MIWVEHLTKQFGETIAVNDLSLDIAEGEIFGLIGPDGAGKTTAYACHFDRHAADFRARARQ